MAQQSDVKNGGGKLTAANFFQAQAKKPVAPGPVQPPPKATVAQQFREADQAASKVQPKAPTPAAPAQSWLDAAAQRFRETISGAAKSALDAYGQTLPGQFYASMGRETGITNLLKGFDNQIQKAADFTNGLAGQPRQPFGQMFTAGLADAGKLIADPGGYLRNLIEVAPGVWLPRDSPAAQAYTTDRGEGDAWRRRFSYIPQYTQVGQALYPKGSVLDRTSRGDYSMLKPYVDQNNPGFDTEKRYFYNPQQYNWGPKIPDNTGKESGQGSGYGSGYGRGGRGGGGYSDGGGYGNSRQQVSEFYNQLANWRVLQVQGG